MDASINYGLLLSRCVNEDSQMAIDGVHHGLRTVKVVERWVGVLVGEFVAEVKSGLKRVPNFHNNAVDQVAVGVANFDATCEG